MDYLEKAARVLDIEIFELNRLRERLGENFARAVELIKEAVDTRGKVVVVGVGKSGHIGAKIAATLTSTGSPAVVLEVGARFSGHASCSMFTSRSTCAFWASVDFESPHMAIILT